MREYCRNTRQDKIDAASSAPHPEPLLPLCLIKHPQLSAVATASWTETRGRLAGCAATGIRGTLASICVSVGFGHPWEPRRWNGRGASQSVPGARALEIVFPAMRPEAAELEIGIKPWQQIVRYRRDRIVLSRS